MSIPLYTPKQVYRIEKQWFDTGNHSYGLMQQAAWQMANVIKNSHNHHTCAELRHEKLTALKVWVWVGSGNNGGDGWLVASYLSQYGANVTVIEVAEVATEDAKRAKQQAQNQQIHVITLSEFESRTMNLQTGVVVDALFGIGLDRAPTGGYATAIDTINQFKKQATKLLDVVSIDVPSGLEANTGQVFDSCAVKADVTLCLVARKLGLHLKDGMDYTGRIVDLSLIPSVLTQPPIAWLQYRARPLPYRHQNSHKGSYGHALIIGGNQVDGSQGMGGAAILAAKTAFATGVGKLTVACHRTFHSSVISSAPNAMSIDLHDVDGVQNLMTQCDALAIGMGLGRDKQSSQLFSTYLQCAIDNELDLVIDADGLYHLATLTTHGSGLIESLKSHAVQHQVWFTPHSGEAARLLDKEVTEVESNRLATVEELETLFAGSWLLKGAGSIVKHKDKVNVCARGNPGMATAGMGDVLSGLAVGLLAQTALPEECRTLQQAVMLHAVAGDTLKQSQGIWALQASDMPTAVGQVCKQLTTSSL